MVWTMFVGTCICALISGLCVENRRWTGALISGLVAVICFGLYAYELINN